MNDLLVISFTIFVLFLTVGFSYCFISKKDWNNGICPNCKKGNWISLDINGKATKYYSCNKCGKFFYAHIKFITKKFIKYDIKYIRKEKLKKLK